MTPHWRAQVTEAVRTQVPANKKTEPGAVENFGAATRVDDDGWYEVATTTKPVRADELVDLRLAAGPPDKGEPTYRVMASVDGTEKLRVQVGAHAPVTGLYLWASRVPRGMLVKSLLKALESMAAGGLVDRLATGRLDAVPKEVPLVRGLSKEHARAFHACTTPGVRAIWGPPGTGKTTVLSQAVDELLNRGQRVLLVSGTNVAVDNVLTRVVAARDPAPGEIVRVGAPHLVEIQRDGRVSLPRLVEARLAELADRRRAVQQELVDLDNSPELTTLAALEARLDQYDHTPYLEARKRIDAAALVGLRAKAVDDALALVNRAHAERERHRAALAAVERDQQAAEAAGGLLDEADSFREELDAAEARRNRLRDEVMATDKRYHEALDEQTQANGQPALTRWRNRQSIRDLAADVASRERDLAAAVAAARDADEQFDELSRELVPRIEWLEREAAPFDRRAIRWLTLDIVQARGALRDASAAMARAEEQHGAALRTLRNAERESVVTDADRELVRRIEEAGLDTAFQQRRRQRTLAEPLLARRRELTEQHENLLVEWEKQQVQAEPEIIGAARMVAATLARLHMNSAVAKGEYDVVLIDEAAAASLPELLLAASKAKRTVAFLGDFCQLGPISPQALPKNAALAGWLTRDCFQLVGIEQPVNAVEHSGCVSLLTTHRFGQRVVELANRIAYCGHLVANTGPAVSDSEIVLVNTDGVGDMAQIRRPGGRSGRWWPVGSVIAHALAERHHGRGESVGIVTPYRAQAEATRDYLVDGDTLGDGTEVGTTHAFQGREFDAVVLDLVEDGTLAGWAAKGSLRSGNPFERNGARLINVGATRARRRLYLVTSWNAVATAKPDTAFAQIREMAMAGIISGVHAAKLLGLEESTAAEKVNTLASDIWAAFEGHVTVEAIHDEWTYYPAALSAIDAATTSIWLWSPWFNDRQEQVLPHLAAAKERGVRTVVFVSDATDNEKDQDPDRQAAGEARLAQLRAAVTLVVRIKAMHQKILVIDEAITFLGSLNTLSHSQRRPRREIMVRHRGSRYAKRILRHERANTFARPPKCPQCGEQLELRRSANTRRNYVWEWVCATHSRSVRHEIPDDKPSNS